MAYGIKLKVWGAYACFTRPEMKVERVSYDVITPSAARGILEAIYWKPAIRWVIDRIHVLNPIQFMNIRRNEVEGKIALGNIRKTMKDAQHPLEMFIEDNRQQRAAMILRDVAYVIEAHFTYTGPDDHNDGKHLDCFKRRAREGRCHMQPYLGCREFSAHFRLLEDDEPIPASHLKGQGEKDLGYMLHDLVFPSASATADSSTRKPRRRTQDNLEIQPRFFRAVMKDGIIEVPPFHAEEVKA